MTMRFQRDKVIEVEIQFIGRRRAGGFQKKSSHHLISSTKGGGRYQGVGAADKAIVALGPNCLFGSRRVDNLRIPP
jgi:hypothetical protein